MRAETELLAVTRYWGDGLHTDLMQVGPPSAGPARPGANPLLQQVGLPTHPGTTGPRSQVLAVLLSVSCFWGGLDTEDAWEPGV